jgi:predicted  nucleic acid-binding Zn-ribbon protein
VSIVYLCYDCKKRLRLDGFAADNECGRKGCIKCGCNDTVYVIDKKEYEDKNVRKR